VTLTAPAAGATISRTTATVLTATHSSTLERETTQMDFFFDGGWIGYDAEGSNGWSFSWTPEPWQLAEAGPHVITAQASINGGQYAAVSAGTPVLAAGGPTATVSVPSTTVGKVVNVTASVAGGGAVSYVQFYVNGEHIGSDSDPTGGWSTSWDTKYASDGFLALRAVAETTNGQATSAPRYVSLLNLYGAVTAPTNGATVSGTYQLKAFATADQESAVEWVKWYVDGIHVGSDSAAGYAMNWNSTTVSDGAHTIKARVFASDGRWRDSATWNITVNN
jgi:large repetitive protein